MKTWLPLTAFVVLSLASPTIARCASSGQSSQSPRFSLNIQLRQDAIRADSEVPLEVTMTSTSDEVVAYGILAFGPPLWSYFCNLDIRDSEGKRVEQKPLVSRFQAIPASGPRLQLPTREGFTVEILVNRCYDLSRPGKYTIQARMSDWPRMDVKSNVVTLTLQEPPRPTEDLNPRFSIVVTAPYSKVRAGYQIPVKIALKNTSTKKISVRSWQERDGTGHEFSSGIQVRDLQGNPASPTQNAQAFESESEYPAGRYTFVSLEPGETYEETRIAGQLYDIARPGTYTLQIVLFDPETNGVVKSNVAAVDVQNPESSAPVAAQPPFTLDIRQGQTFTRSSGRPGHAIYLAITNRSDHTIDFDIGAGDNDLDVFDSHGNLAALTENGRRSRGKLRTAAKGGTPIQRLQPGETKSGGMLYLEDYYDVSRAAKYTIQMRAFDDESQTIVTSNRITVNITK